MNILSSLLNMWRNFFYLALTPYKTMRKISQETDYVQIILIFVLVYAYFIYANIIRQKTFHPFIISTSSGISFFLFIFTFLLSIGFFKSIAHIFKIYPSFKKLLFLSSYSILPTLIWFFATSTLYLLLPPPRTVSILGQLFSFTFIVFSLTLLFWRAILLYLTLRFSYKAQFYTIVVSIFSFFAWFLPYSYLLYTLRFFRIPFL